MNDSRDPKAGIDSFGAAFDVIGRVAAAVVVMVVPGVVGQKLDQHWGTGYLALLGFLFGVPFGMYYLLEVSGALRKRRDKSPNQSASSDSPPKDNVSDSPQQRPPA